MFLKLLFVFSTAIAHGQNMPFELHEIKSIGSDSISFDDLKALKAAIGNSRVVFLGEPSHSEGNVFEAKTRLVKFLHEDLGFNVLAFESGFYDVDKAQREINAGVSVREAMDKSVFPIWTQAVEFQSLIEYLEKQKKQITLAGFDLQISGEYVEDYLSDELEDFINNFKAKEGSLSLEDFDKTLVHMASYQKFPADQSLESFVQQCKQYKTLIKLMNGNKKAAFWVQCLDNIEELARVIRHTENLTEATFKAKDSNMRDKQMADNLLYLTRKYPDEKIICWGASGHFAYQLKGIDNEELKEFVPMGKLVKDKLKDKVFSIAFTASEGHYGAFKSDTIVPVPRPYSLEDLLAKTDVNYAFLPLKAVKTVHLC